MAWTAPLTWTPNSPLTAAQLNTHLRDNMLETEAALSTGGGGYFVADGVNSIVERQAAHNETVASSTTTSSTYSNLADGISTSVTVNVGPTCLVVWSVNYQQNTAGAFAMCSIDISGANTNPASDSFAIYRKLQNYTSYPAQHMQHIWLDSMNPGSTTFTLKYRAVSGGTATFASRRIAAFPY
ncbi:hypothetical protein [Streptomyces sioyaensis]|uniref:hypothetical protein n=1 Tax=Streptomyces sioyaensis TaxID=67364 RepID=UPI003D711E8D